MGNNPIGFIYSEEYMHYNLGEGHPLNPIRIELTYSLMRQMGLFDSPNLKQLHPRMATDDEVLRIHDKRYLGKLKELNSVEKPGFMAVPEFGLGPGDNPIFPKIYDASMMVVGASISAAEYLLAEENNKRSVNLLGGLHHAMPEMASGFCILNDPACAIQFIIDKRPKTRIMYLDIDCHAGDGVQWIFYDRSDVLTMSFHQDPATIFPGTGQIKENGKGEGKGYALNVPLKCGTFDKLYMDIFRKLVPQVMDAYQPDIIVTQLGVDTHFSDPITNLSLSTGGHERLYKELMEYIPKYVSTNKWLALGGGGYTMSVVARSWTLLLANLLDIELKNEIPKTWLEEHKQKCPDEFSFTELRDRNTKAEEMQLKNPYFIDQIEAYHDQVIETYEKELIPQIKGKK